MGDIKKTDWIASLIVPGWTQVMCYAFPAATFFFLVALITYTLIGWRWGLWVHACAALHGWALVREHISGKRQATAEAYLQRRGIEPSRRVH